MSRQANAIGSIRAVVRTVDTRASIEHPTTGTRENREAMITVRRRIGTRVMVLTGQTRIDTGRISKKENSPALVGMDNAQVLAVQALRPPILTNMKNETNIAGRGTKTEITRALTVTEIIETKPVVTTIQDPTMAPKGITGTVTAAAITVTETVTMAPALAAME